MTISGKETGSTSQMKPMPPVMRLVITLIFSVFSILFALVLVDDFYTGNMLSGNIVKTTASINKREISKYKNGKRYYISYEFRLGNQTFHRSTFFHLLKKKTEVTRNEYETLQEGDTMPVVYAKTNPEYNQPEKGNNDRNMFWIWSGMIVFGVISVNEISRFMKKPSASKGP